MKKKITINDLAREAGVSIGTVDRALNNRPGINSATKQKILALAQKYNYRPNPISKALASRKTYKIGVIMLPETSPFTRDLIRITERTGRELRDYGFNIQIRPLHKISPDEQIRLIQEFAASGVSAVALEGIDSEQVTQAVNRISLAGIPVVTFNSDLKNSNRLCFVGQDLYRSGQVAADILGRFMGRRGRAFILHGSSIVAAHNERVKGFSEVIKCEFPDIEIARIEQSHDDEQHAHEVTLEVLRNDPDVSGIYVAATGSVGAGRAVLELGRQDAVRIVGNDLTPDIEHLIRHGVIDATLLQDPETQGTEPLRILFRLLFEQTRPDREFYYTRIDILTRHML